LRNSRFLSSKPRKSKVLIKTKGLKMFIKLFTISVVLFVIAIISAVIYAIKITSKQGTSKEVTKLDLSFGIGFLLSAWLAVGVLAASCILKFFAYID
jgi:hypothetical protein